MTWADLVRLVERHPRLSVGRLQVEAARSGIDAAEEVPNPTLEGSLGQGIDQAGGASRVEWGVGLTLPLGWVAQRAARVEAAEAELGVAQAERQALRRDVLQHLRTVFWNLAYEQARLASLAELEAQTEAWVETVSQRVAQGEARPVDATRVEIELEKVRSELEAARLLCTARQAELGSWLGLPVGRTLVAVVDLGELPAAASREAVLARARAGHPALAVARARTRRLDAEAQSERAARVPSFALTGFAVDEIDRRAYGVELAVDLPIWNWNSGRIAQADALLAAGRERARAEALEIDASVLQAQAACEASVVVATRFKERVVPRSERAASTMEDAYRLGEAGLLDVLDARRTLLDSRRLSLSALVQAQLDCSRLDALVGEEFR